MVMILFLTGIDSLKKYCLFSCFIGFIRYILFDCLILYVIVLYISSIPILKDLIKRSLSCSEMGHRSLDVKLVIKTCPLQNVYYIKVISSNNWVFPNFFKQSTG